MAAYDPLGNITSVTQNAQAASGSRQTRAYAFDWIGRLLTEQNPETGAAAISYTYDTADASCGSYSSVGDLVEKKDAMGNVTCMKYDAAHRVTPLRESVWRWKWIPVSPPQSDARLLDAIIADSRDGESDSGGQRAGVHQPAFSGMVCRTAD